MARKLQMPRRERKRARNAKEKRRLQNTGALGAAQRRIRDGNKKTSQL